MSSGTSPSKGGSGTSPSKGGSKHKRKSSDDGGVNIPHGSSLADLSDLAATVASSMEQSGRGPPASPGIFLPPGAFHQAPSTPQAVGQSPPVGGPSGWSLGNDSAGVATPTRSKPIGNFTHTRTYSTNSNTGGSSLPIHPWQQGPGSSGLQHRGHKRQESQSQQFGHGGAYLEGGDPTGSSVGMGSTTFIHSSTQTPFGSSAVSPVGMGHANSFRQAHHERANSAGNRRAGEGKSKLLAPSSPTAALPKVPSRISVFDQTSHSNYTSENDGSGTEMSGNMRSRPDSGTDVSGAWSPSTGAGSTNESQRQGRKALRKSNHHPQQTTDGTTIVRAPKNNKQTFKKSVVNWFCERKKGAIVTKLLVVGLLALVIFQFHEMMLSSLTPKQCPETITLHPHVSSLTEECPHRPVYVRSLLENPMNTPPLFEAYTPKNAQISGTSGGEAGGEAAAIGGKGASKGNSSTELFHTPEKEKVCVDWACRVDWGCEANREGQCYAVWTKIYQFVRPLPYFKPMQTLSFGGSPGAAERGFNEQQGAEDDEALNLAQDQPTPVKKPIFVRKDMRAEDNQQLEHLWKQSQDRRARAAANRGDAAEDAELDYMQSVSPLGAPPPEASRFMSTHAHQRQRQSSGASPPLPPGPMTGAPTSEGVSRNGTGSAVKKKNVTLPVLNITAAIGSKNATLGNGTNTTNTTNATEVPKTDLELAEELRVEDPYYKQDAHGGDSDHELVCSWVDQNPSPRTHLPPRGWSNHDYIEEKVESFKHFTSFSFQNWYDWKAPTSKMNKAERYHFQMTGKHEGPDKLYKLKYFCVRPTGGLMGYRPKMETYEGGDDVRSFTQDLELDVHVKPYQKFFSEVESMSQPPEWFIDRKIAIMPLASRSNNPGHALHRLTGLMANIEKAFPRKPVAADMPPTPAPTTQAPPTPEPQVTTMAPSNATGTAGNLTEALSNTTGNGTNNRRDGAFDNGGETESYTDSPQEADPRRAQAVQADTNQMDLSKAEDRFATFDDNMTMSLPRDDVTTMYVMIQNEKGLEQLFNYCSPGCTFRDFAFSRFTTLATTSHFIVWDKHTDKNLLFPNDHSGQSNDPVCFKEAVVYQACHSADCKKSAKQPDVDLGTEVYSMYFKRSEKIQRMIALRLRRCVGLSPQPRADPNRVNPKVLYSYRSSRRGFAEKPSILGRLNQVVKKKLNGTLYIDEMGHTSTVNHVFLYSNVDVLYGPYGAGLYYGFLMPPGSIGVEVNYILNRQSTISGIDRNSGEQGKDYAEMFKTGGIHHVVAALPYESARTPTDGQISLSLETATNLMLSANCILNHTQWDNRWASDAMREECEVGESELAHEVKTAGRDLSGVHVRRAVRAVLPQHQSSSVTRLQEYYSYSKEVSKALGFLRNDGFNKLLLVYNCTDADQFKLISYYEGLFYHKYVTAATEIFLYVHDRRYKPSLQDRLASAEEDDAAMNAAEAEWDMGGGRTSQCSMNHIEGSTMCHSLNEKECHHKYDLIIVDRKMFQFYDNMHDKMTGFLKTTGYLFVV